MINLEHLNLFNKNSKGQADIIKQPSDGLIFDFNGTEVEMSISTRPRAMMIEGKQAIVYVYNADDLLDSIRLVRDALLLEQNGILSGAFETSADFKSNHLRVDYHSLTMLGDRFDKKVEKLKNKLERE